MSHRLKAIVRDLIAMGYTPEMLAAKTGAEWADIAGLMHLLDGTVSESVADKLRELHQRGRKVPQ